MRWKHDETLHIEDLAGEALHCIYLEAYDTADPDLREKLAKWAVSSEAAGRRRAAVEIARSNRRVAIRPCDLNCDGWLLNCLNGTHRPAQRRAAPARPGRPDQQAGAGRVRPSGAVGAVGARPDGGHRR